MAGVPNVNDLKNSVRAYKASLTKREAAVRRLVDHLEENPSDIAADELRRAFSNSKATYEHIGQIYRQLQEHDPAQFNTYVEAHNEVEETIVELESVVLPILQAFMAPPPPPAAAALPAPAAGAPMPKINKGDVVIITRGQRLSIGDQIT